jgi:hypothetical protein
MVDIPPSSSVTSTSTLHEIDHNNSDSNGTSAATMQLLTSLPPAPPSVSNQFTANDDNASVVDGDNGNDMINIISDTTNIDNDTNMTTNPSASTVGGSNSSASADAPGIGLVGTAVGQVDNINNNGATSSSAAGAGRLVSSSSLSMYDDDRRVPPRSAGGGEKDLLVGTLSPSLSNSHNNIGNHLHNDRAAGTAISNSNGAITLYPVAGLSTSTTPYTFIPAAVTSSPASLAAPSNEQSVATEMDNQSRERDNSMDRTTSINGALSSTVSTLLTSGSSNGTSATESYSSSSSLTLGVASLPTARSLTVSPGTHSLASSSSSSISLISNTLSTATDSITNSGTTITSTSSTTTTVITSSVSSNVRTTGSNGKVSNSGNTSSSTSASRVTFGGGRTGRGPTNAASAVVAPRSVPQSQPQVSSSSHTAVTTPVLATTTSSSSLAKESKSSTVSVSASSTVAMVGNEAIVRQWEPRLITYYQDRGRMGPMVGEGTFG